MKYQFKGLFKAR